MKKMTFIVFLTSILVLAGCTAEAESQLIAETKQNQLTKEEFYEALKDNYGEQVLKEMILLKVLEARYDVTENDIEEEIHKLKDIYGDSYDSFVEQSFGDEATIRDHLEVHLRQDRAILENVTVSEEKLKERYERKKTEIHAQHIVVSDEDTAYEVKGLLDDGEPFEVMAGRYSIDETAHTGGDLDYFTAGRMVEAFEDAAYSMKPGEISDPVETEYGFHIIKVNEIRDTEEATKTFAEVEEDLKRELISEQVDEEQRREILINLVKESEIKVYIEEFNSLFQ